MQFGFANKRRETRRETRDHLSHGDREKGSFLGERRSRESFVAFYSSRRVRRFFLRIQSVKAIGVLIYMNVERIAF